MTELLSPENFQNISSIALIGIGLIPVIGAVSIDQFYKMLERRSPQAFQSVKDAVKNAPQHLSLLLNELQFMSSDEVNKIIQATCKWWERKPKERRIHNALIEQFQSQARHNQQTLDE